MARILRLPNSLVNKIAAGEVIERPASVVKELLENALDAGARRIDVQIQQGGLDQIRVVDDGQGITTDDLPLAVASHATSKLRDTEGLFHIDTLGFRGEALASIAEISHLSIRSRPHDQDAGAELRVEGGQVGNVTPCSCAPGTTVEVVHLFFNTPVRRKFLRSSQTEMGHLVEAFTRIALAHEEVYFTLQHNERTLFDLPGTDTWRSRIRALSGDEIAENLLPVERIQDAIRLHGFAVHPAVSRGNNRSQYLFLNRRAIRDRSLSHAISEAYRGLLLTGRYPLGFLRIDMPADLVDVNVHPTKAEVRFVDSGALYSLVLGALRSEFLQRDLTVRGRSVAPDDPSDRPLASGSSDSIGQARRAEVQLWGSPSWDDPGIAQARATAASIGTQRPSANFSPFPPFRPFDSPAAGISTWPPNTTASANVPSTMAGTANRPFSAGEPAPPADVPVTEDCEPDDGPMATVAAGPRALAAMQICNRYLVTETDEGLMVIDQHALHERIVYEELKAKVMAGKLEQQRLLVPEPVELSAAEASLVLEQRDVLLALGMEVEPFGGNTVVIMSYPAMLANLSPAETLRKIAERLTDGGATLQANQLVDELLHMIACKAAIKAGDRLTAQEVASLIELRHLVHDAHHCPHGRPSTLVFTRAELDRQFRRT